MTAYGSDQVAPTDYDGTPLPAVAPPRGTKFYLNTWSGRLIVVNFVVLIMMARQSDSLFMPTPEVLLKFGAKDLPALVHGEYWRFFTPIFVHIGLLHFFFNSMGLYYVGYHLETILGAGWFFAIYLVAGILGNISSATFSVAVSAGASGALFGLLGAGFTLERLVRDKIQRLTGRRPRQTVYASMVVINLIFGFLVPGIDNAAHLGGMVAGIVVALIMLNFRRNELVEPNRSVGYALTVAVIALSTAGIVWSMNSSRVVSRFERAAETENVPMQQYYMLTQALRVNKYAGRILVKRGRLLLLNGEIEGLEDVRIAVEDLSVRNQIRDLIVELRKFGQFPFATEIQTMLDQAARDTI